MFTDTFPKLREFKGASTIRLFIINQLKGDVVVSRFFTSIGRGRCRSITFLTRAKKLDSGSANKVFALLRSVFTSPRRRSKLSLDVNFTTLFEEFEANFGCLLPTLNINKTFVFGIRVGDAHSHFANGLAS
jgi:hypothetical protein